MPDDKTPEQLEAERLEAERAAEAAKGQSTEPKVDTTDVLAAYNSVLAEKDRQMRAALAEVERLKAAQNKEPVLTPEEASKKFFENPVELIRNEINRALQPITQSIGTFTQQNQYTQLKAQMVQDPRFTDLPKIEKEFDQLMQGQEINPNTMIGAYYAAYGMVAKTTPQRLIDSAPASSTSGAPSTTRETTPPHLRPSTPAAPKREEPVTKRPPLTENERTLMRINGIKTEEEWWALMDAKPDTVITMQKAGGK